MTNEQYAKAVDEIHAAIAAGKLSPEAEQVFDAVHEVWEMMEEQVMETAEVEGCEYCEDED